MVHAKGLFRWGALAALASLLIATVTLIVEGTLPSRSAPAPYVPRSRSGDEIVAVFLITETCPAARREDFKISLRTALEALRETASVRGYRTVFVGVAIGGNTRSAQRFISEFAHFDEVMIGRGWLGFGATSYVWRDIPGAAAVPQLVVLRRRIEISSDGISISPDSLLLRLTDADDIIRWSSAGAPLDLLVHHAPISPDKP